MYQFFYCLYYALFTGQWNGTWGPRLTEYINAGLSFVVNALGGEFQTNNTYAYLSGELTGYGLMSNILALITMFGVCFSVLKLTKMVFSIFFGGR